VWNLLKILSLPLPLLSLSQKKKKERKKKEITVNIIEESICQAHVTFWTLGTSD